jgi:hypothetical protein
MCCSGVRTIVAKFSKGLTNPHDKRKSLESRGAYRAESFFT